jgi:hypothetical protein
MAGVESLIVEDKPKDSRPAIDREKVKNKTFNFRT